ncbi:flagellar protein FliT [Sideroxyarcus emersonii]|uniref:Flagellar protein FliT n=1 Tax=Sideroxyarcus emersonii TaxID=2764705 RepID=A0AAN1X8X0_9PROT|nr:flagellar protein FliT [Sideroxyarcus emersonii]BCK86747.1 flagellar protein FliT [Sideroxyarcus emersonii]
MSMLLEEYQRLSGITGQMRDAAVGGEWDRLISLEQECKRKVEEIKPRDVVPSNPEERAQKIALLKKILADDADIRSRTESWMEQLQRIMQSNRSEQRLQQAYLVNS